MPSLTQVLRSSELELEVVVHAAGDPPVRWVATSELADPTPFLEGGEILLTTGLATAEWVGEWAAYVARLARTGVAALGFGLGLTHAEVPSSLTDAAREAGLALFTVPRAVPFVAITRTVARLVQLEEQQALRTALTTQQQLTREAARPDGPRAILRRLARAVGGEAVVCDPDGAVLVRDRSSRRRPDVVPEAIRGVVARLRPEGMRASYTDSGPRGSTLVQPLGLTGTPHSYLVLSATTPWEAGAHAAVATAAALLSLQGERWADAVAIAREIRGAALALLLDGRVEPGLALLALRAADAVPLDVSRSFHVLRTWTSDPGEALPTLERWVGADPTTRLAAVPSATDGQPVVLLAAGTDPTGALAALGRDGRAGIGAARPLADLPASAATAAAALDRATVERPLGRWDDVVDGGLVALLQGPEADTFARAVLGPLAELSTESAALLATLDAFHQHHGQLTVMAAALGVHRNTIRRRLRRVEHLTGRSPDDPRGRVELWVAAELLRPVPTGVRLSPR